MFSKKKERERRSDTGTLRKQTQCNKPGNPGEFKGERLTPAASPAFPGGGAPPNTFSRLQLPACSRPKGLLRLVSSVKRAWQKKKGGDGEKDGGGGSSISCNNRRHKVDLSVGKGKRRARLRGKAACSWSGLPACAEGFGAAGRAAVPAVARRGPSDGRALKVA